MAEKTSAGSPRLSWRETWAAMFSGRMLVALLMGFGSGLPLLLTGSVLQAWLKDRGVDLTSIGLFALVGLPYTLKFLWAPLFDRYALPLFGRRRGWLIASQIALAIALFALSIVAPAPDSLLWVSAAALLVAFFSASQDIVVDAYRRESLSDDELGLGSALYVNGYRIGMLLAGGGGLIIADQASFGFMYQFMAACMAACVLVTFFAPEPPLPAGAPKTLQEAVVLPFRDYFQRHGAWIALAFILLYKIGDTMASAMTTPFYLELGYSKTEIGAVVKLFGFWATIAGGTLGGIVILRVGLTRSLWLFGIGQMISTLGFVALAYIGHDNLALAAVIAVENFTGGLGTAAFVGFMGALTDRRFTATQYALLSSLMGVPRVLLSAPTGWLAATMGWPVFFALCTLIAIPGLLLIRRVTLLATEANSQENKTTSRTPLSRWRLALHLWAGVCLHAAAQVSGLFKVFGGGEVGYALSVATNAIFITLLLYVAGYYISFKLVSSLDKTILAPTKQKIVLITLPFVYFALAILLGGAVGLAVSARH